MASGVALQARPARTKRLGCETPRIFTPPLRELTPETSLGFACIEFAEDVLDIRLAPWQRWLFIHMLELGLDGDLRFRTVIVLVARQNGKSMMSVVLALFFMYVLGRHLVIGTAQQLDIAEEMWEEAVAIVDDIPELAELKKKVVEGNGRKTLILKTGERYRVKAANRRAGRGLSGNLILLDELREHTTWDAWAALTKTTMARAMSLVLAMSNAGDASSIVLRYLRKMCHAVLGDPDGINAADDPMSLLPGDEEMDAWGEPILVEEEDGDTLGLFEWSARPGCDRWDRDAWAQSNPSMGYTELSERAIASAARTDPEWVFRTEVLCQWADTSASGPFPQGAWEATKDETSKRWKKRDPVCCIDVSADSRMTRIAVAAWRKDGKAHIEVVASRPGQDWVKPWLLDKGAPWRRRWKITGQGRGAPVSPLIEELQEAKDKDGEPLFDVTPWQGADLPNGTTAFFQAVLGNRGDLDEADIDGTFEPRPRVFHRPSPILDVAAGVAVTRPLGDGGWVWDRMKSPVDISGLVAATGAHWLLMRPKEEVVKSAYESHRLETV